MSIIAVTALFALALAFVIGVVLGFFKDFFKVPGEPMVASIMEILPGANCGVCGYPGCENFAIEVVAGKAKANACTVGGSALPGKIAAITGIDGGEVVETVVVLACQGSSIHTPLKGTYTGIPTCRGAKVAGGTKLCMWGCLGFGDCIKACMFGAIAVSENDLPIVDYSKCTGCNLCVAECPLSLFKIVRKDQKGSFTLCASTNPVKQIVVKSCRISCFKCGLCIKSCPQNCLSMENNIPIADWSKCTSCGTCAAKCPSKAIKILEHDVFV
jgi:Na+-translocating ferredoxin:NAD+ oxidoreductase RNF subunit RnfB